MEPNKIDTKIREQLGSREIKPSEQAWDRLDAMLSIGENKKKKNYSWLYVAASFILFSSLGLWFYNQNKAKDSIVIENNIVTSDKDVQFIKDTLNRDKPIINQEKFISKPVEAIVDNTKKQSTEEKAMSHKRNANAINQNKEKINAIAQNNTKQEILSEKEEVVPTKNKFITGEMILASVENRKVENKEELNKEVKSKLRVNTATLLSSVETELDEDYKETTIDKLTRNFKQVKSALANRNYEE